MDKELGVLSQIKIEKGLWKGWDNEKKYKNVRQMTQMAYICTPK